jgi:hypothetical protein
MFLHWPTHQIASVSRKPCCCMMIFALLFFIFFWVGGAIATGMFASIRRNRDGFGWFALALVISPILAFFFCTILRERAPGDSPEAPLALGALLLAIFMILVFAFFFTQ